MILVAAALAAGIFAIDIRTPFGTDLGVLYVVPVLLTAFGGRSRLTLLAAATASGLTIAGAILSPREVSMWAAVASRLIALAVIWITWAILARFRQTDAALDEQTKALADVNDAIDQASIVAKTDQTGRITYVNDKFCEVSQYAREELLGQDHRIISSGVHPQDFIATLWRTIASGRIWRGEFCNRAKDGSLYWVDTTIVPFLDDRGKPYQYMAIRYLITDRKRQEELLREQGALARLGAMAAVVAHEVKNPIAGIRGALQVIVSRMPSDQRDRAVMGEIIARLDGLNGIVEDLLVFARPRPIRAVAVDLAALVWRTADLIRRDPALASVEIHIVGRCSIVQADPEQLQVVVQNILINAAQAMEGRGAIEVTISNGDRCCRMAIADHGPGMKADVLEKAFDAFYTTKHRGTGLGLSIAKRIIEAHGGNIRIDTSDAVGTIVTVTLPLPR